MKVIILFPPLAVKSNCVAAQARLACLPASQLKWDDARSRRFNFNIASFLTPLDSMNSINKGFKKALFKIHFNPPLYTIL